jgi:FKBP-type peptidyl-prolyl cis-trans isomerase
MSLGERSEFVIAPSYAYGEKGFEDAIPPNATLVFDVCFVDQIELLAIDT